MTKELHGDHRRPTAEQLTLAADIIEVHLAVLSGGQLWLAKEMLLSATRTVALPILEKQS